MLRFTWNERKGRGSATAKSWPVKKGHFSIQVQGLTEGPGSCHQGAVSVSAAVPLQNLIQQPLQKKTKSVLHNGCRSSVDKRWMCSVPVQLKGAAPVLHSSSDTGTIPLFFFYWPTVCHNSNVGRAVSLNGGPALEHLLPWRRFCFMRNESLKNWAQWLTVYYNFSQSIIKKDVLGKWINKYWSKWRYNTTSCI